MRAAATAMLVLAGACIPRDGVDSPLDVAMVVGSFVLYGGLLVAALFGGSGKAAPMVCTACETVDFPRTRTKGSILIEIVLWLCFLVPGLVYTLWRLTSGRVKVCRACGSETIVPTDSPAGRRIVGS